MRRAEKDLKVWIAQNSSQRIFIKVSSAKTVSSKELFCCTRSIEVVHALCAHTGPHLHNKSGEILRVTNLLTAECDKAVTCKNCGTPGIIKRRLCICMRTVVFFIASDNRNQQNTGLLSGILGRSCFLLTTGIVGFFRRSLFSWNCRVVSNSKQILKLYTKKRKNL